MIVKQLKMKTKNWKQDFFGVLLITLGAGLSGSTPAGKCVIRAGEGAIRAGQDF